MLKGRGTTIVAVALAGLLLALSALMYPAMVPHSAHHAHHESATHATALCSWMCAAGQASETGVPAIQVAFAPLAQLRTAPAVAPDRPTQFARPSRAPPSFIA